jgi:hypothetical protein
MTSSVTRPRRCARLRGRESTSDAYIQDEWRKFVSPTCPGPRSAHAAAATPVGGGQIFLFGQSILSSSALAHPLLRFSPGGEFSSPSQNSFHHYRDFWSFDVHSHQWTRIEPRGRDKAPPARSGHRLAAWKHFIVLFGGFFDPGAVSASPSHCPRCRSLRRRGQRGT